MEITNNYIAVLDEISRKFGLAIDWTQQNVQPYLQELMSRVIKYEIFKSTVWLTISVGVLFMVGLCVKFAINKYKKDMSEWLIKPDGSRHEFNKPEISDYYVYSLLIIPIILGFPIFMFNVIKIAKCITLPELVFFNIIQSLIM